MNKTDLVSIMATKSGLSKKDSEKALNAFMESITEALTNGDRIQLVGFGTFDVTERAGRIGRNPKTGDAVQIEPSKAPRFKAGKALKDSVNA